MKSVVQFAIIFNIIFFMAESRIITIENTSSINQEGDQIVICPDSGVKKAAYNYFRFSKLDFYAFDVFQMKRPFSLNIKAEEDGESTQQPSNPNEPHP